MKWDDLNDDQFDLTGDATGWGINLSTNLKLAEARVPRLGGLRRGRPELLERRAGGRRASRTTSQDPRTPVVGEALPILGIVAFLDLNWSDEWTSTVGYSLVDIDNSDAHDGLRLQEGPVRAREHPVPPDARTCSWGRRSSGASARTSGTASRRTTCGSSSRPSTTSRCRSEASDERIEDGARRPAAPRRGLRRDSASWRPRRRPRPRPRSRPRSTRRTRSTRTSRRARTPTTSRPSPRSTRRSSASRS